MTTFQKIGLLLVLVSLAFLPKIDSTVEQLALVGLWYLGVFLFLWENEAKK